MITIFTPTYNRGYIIDKVYESLSTQTFKDFEWLVVDDGSTDNTELLFKQWLKEDVFFKINYYKTKNGGKHRAINFGLEYAQGDKFFIVDSDDYILDNALEKVNDWFETIKGKEHEFCGISGNRAKNLKDIWGTTFEGNKIDCTYLESIHNNITGDKAEIYFTDILRKNKFPEFQNEKFIQESAVWHEIANQDLKLRYFNEIIYITEYLDDGLSANSKKNYIENPQGIAYVLKQQNKYYNFSYLKKLSQSYYYYDNVRQSTNIFKAAKYLNTTIFEILVAFALLNIKNLLLKLKILK